jgi:zinc protease
VTVRLLTRTGAKDELMDKAGLANMTASMLTKGTKNRSAEQIAQEIEFLGGSIDSGADWNFSLVTITVTSDKLDQAMEIMSDVVLNPIFPESELELLRSQTLDGLTYSLTQPGFLGNYVASKYSFKEHPAGGTVDSIQGISRDDIDLFFKKRFVPNNSVLLVAGDITSVRAAALATKFFGSWKSGDIARYTSMGSGSTNSSIQNRFLVLDLPSSGQASVTYAKKLKGLARSRSDHYYPASLLNSLLGGGYSSRLNQEIRIKRGLSYGAGSTFRWRMADSQFGTRTQTKNESAPEVAQLVLAEIDRLAKTKATDNELDPRRAVLVGDFGRNIETATGIVNTLVDLYAFYLPISDLSGYAAKVNGVTDAQIEQFAKAQLLGGDIIIVGDYAKFKEDLAKRFPDITPTVIPAAELDITKANLLK